MKLSKADEKTYPGLRQYVKGSLPSVINIPKIVNAIKAYGQLSKPQLKRALTYGKTPTLKVVAMPKICGEFSPGLAPRSNELRISRALVRQFEASGGSKRLTLLVGATILHELTHWGDDRDGSDHPEEEGNMFEKQAYNKVIPCRL